MRRIILAPSFDAEFFEISFYVEDLFGATVADEFEARFRSVAVTLATLPKIGTRDHDYSTTLYGFVLSPNWIFYRFTDDEIVFLHIRNGRMDKKHQDFKG